jgi:hypothetical protein
MLGGGKRLWPSIAAYLLSEQYKAHRAWDMKRVWMMRRLRYRLQQRLDAEREASLYSGQPVKAVTDLAAYDEILAERIEIQEELEQAMEWRRYLRAEEVQSMLAILDDVITFWHPRLAGGTLDTDR